MLKFSRVLFASLLMLLASPSFAALVEASASGKFFNPTLQSHSWYSGAGTNYFEFGKSPKNSWGKPKYGHSSLSFTGHDINLDNLSNKFVIGDLKFVNATSLVNTSIDAIELMVNIDFNSPLMNEAFNFGLGLEQTINTGSNDDDTVDLPSAYTSPNLFVIDGIEYVFMAMFGTLENGIFTETDFLQAPEQGMASTQLVGMFTAVPLPAAVWLLAAGLFGLLGFSKGKAYIEA